MNWDVNRRTFVGGIGALAAAGIAMPSFAKNGKKYNVLMIVTDQEQSIASYPKGLLEKLPAHRELMSRGLLVENFHVHTTPCTPSRGTIFQGQHTQRSGLFLNSDNAPHPVAAEDIPTLGHMMQDAGYYTCYKGKWHLSRINHDRNWTRITGPIYPSTEDAMLKYGFHDYGFDGEELGLTWDGYRSDKFVAGDAARSIFDYVRRDKAGGKPWFQVVGLVNPHDIMFYDATGKQADSRPHPNALGPLRREPGDPLYEENNGFDLPESFYKDDLSTKPEAHRAIRDLNNRFYGEMRHDDEASWHRFINYYYNCLRDVDRRIDQLLWALKESGQMDNTIIIYTSDHGERAGAHGLRQKGATIYREETNIPMIIVHPDFAGGRTTKKLMGAVDIAPTLMSLAGLSNQDIASRYPNLPGIDVSALLASPDAPTARDKYGHLFNYAVAHMWEPSSEKDARGAKLATGEPDYARQFDLSKRRLHRGVHDGRWKFARYFAPAHHHQPQDWKTLSAMNDLELYDTVADPNELVNLAYDRKQRDNILRLNKMVNALVAREIGVDDGREYPGPTEIYNQPV
ncbi:sulfatase-like hydrolase/transferase [Sphingopyxis yananensis]|uniref:sulfatase-like hydrolase/transferase n=1 Tax=Sphingopyxis yananensis TaxID=2886687 RepID=UPI001D11E277|nr:sulfatase-like hydrolase/transferase [Sphingopyxis yananensis]MCC2603487.1 sulfatase-like hydrolase/transferase [Sphingopyxis yananensis]